LLVAAGALALAVPCAAQQAQGSGFYVAPIVEAVLADDDRAVDDAAAFTFAAGFQVNTQWNIELSLFRGRFDGVGGDDLEMDAAGVNALRVFRRDARVAPYLLAGLGAQYKDREFGGSATDAYADAGAGLLAALRRSEDGGRALYLRLDARARYDDGGSRVDYLLGIGLQYAFGSRSSARPPVEAPPPAPVPPPADADRDGVSDSNDRCPGTPPGRPVRADGCEIDGDDDGDSVANSADDCAGTPQGARVDARGCELKEEIRLPLVTFEYNSDRLQPGALPTLDRAVDTLRMNPDLRIEVAGHTDDRGSQAYNLTLSQRRAETVRRYLVDHGVTNVLTVRGYGESEPIADNGTDAGRSENRRVVLRILSQ
jgi:OOP family OmpA-OmpF porin